MNSIIKGNSNGKILYTQNFVNNQKSLLAGAFEACIRPVRFSQVIKEYNLETGMVFGKRKKIFNVFLSVK